MRNFINRKRVFAEESFMVHLLRVKESRLINSDGKYTLVHQSVDGRQFVGPQIPVRTDDRLLVEAPAKPGPNGYYRISKFLKISDKDNDMSVA